MRKGFYCILLVIYSIVLLTACKGQYEDEPISSTEIEETQNNASAEMTMDTEGESEMEEATDDEEETGTNSGYSGGVLYDAEVESKVQEGKQESDTPVDNKSDGKEDDTAVSIPGDEDSDEMEDTDSIQENTYESDILEPPAVSSAGVL